MPNFFLIGAAKSGTTALYHYLKQHPQIYMSSVKEPNFFAFENKKLDFSGPGDDWVINTTVTNLDDYLRLFDKVTNESAIGEASWKYLYYPGTAESIKRHIPEARLFVVLRNPVDRAYSHFIMMRQKAREPKINFAEAVKQEQQRISDNWGADWHYIQVGLYYNNLKRFFDLFGRDQIKVFLYEDLKNSPLIMLQDIFKFLKVDDDFVPDISVKHNQGLVPQNRPLHTFLRTSSPLKSFAKMLVPKAFRKHIKNQIHKINLTKPKPLDQSTREEISKLFREDILKLQRLIKRDLSSWLY
jgi:hypothetical protein